MLRIARGSRITWYDIEQPAPKDIEILRAELPIHELILEELIPQVRHPKLDLFGSHLFLVITIPILRKNGKNGEHAAQLEELDFIFGKDWVVTSRYHPIETVNELFSRVESKREERIEYLAHENPAALLYAVLSAVLRHVIASLGMIEERVEKIERDVAEEIDRKMIQELSALRRDIIDFRRALFPARPVFRALDDAGPALLGADTFPFFRNLTGRIEQIATLLKTLKETVEALEETSHTLITTRTNDIIRILTIFTAAMLPLNLVASIFGMNIEFPFSPNTAHFWIILATMVAVVVSLLAFFRVKKWL